MVQFGVNSLLGWQEYVAGDVFRTMFDVINGMVVLRSGMAFAPRARALPWHMTLNTSGRSGPSASG